MTPLVLGHSRIKSGHFMTSRIDEDDTSSQDESCTASINKTSFEISNLSFDDLSSLMKYLTLAYVEKITNPKWNEFKGVDVTVKNKIRLNNIIWREFHMQYVKKLNPKIVHFQTPSIDHHLNTKVIIMEGKYWKRSLHMITNEYRRWRLFLYHRIRYLNHKKYHCFSQIDEDTFHQFFDQISQDINLNETNYDNCNTLDSLNFPVNFRANHISSSDIIQPRLINLEPILPESSENITRELFNYSTDPYSFSSYQYKPVYQNGFMHNNGRNIQLGSKFWNSCEISHQSINYDFTRSNQSKCSFDMGHYSNPPLFPNRNESNSFSSQSNQLTYPQALTGFLDYSNSYEEDVKNRADVANKKRKSSQNFPIDKEIRKEKNRKVFSIDQDGNSCTLNTDEKRRQFMQESFSRLKDLITDLVKKDDFLKIFTHQSEPNGTREEKMAASEEMPSSKVSKAVILMKTSSVLKLLCDREKSLAMQLEEAREMIASLRLSIKSEWERLTMGATYEVAQFNQRGLVQNTLLPSELKMSQRIRHNKFIVEMTKRNWKYFIFKRIFQQLHVSYFLTVSQSNYEEFELSKMNWIKESCLINRMRPFILQAMCDLSKDLMNLDTKSNNLKKDLYLLAERSIRTFD